MSTPLLSASQLANIQKVGERGLQTDVTIRNRSAAAKDPSNPNGDMDVGYGTAFSVKAWVAPFIDPNFVSEGGAIVSVGDFKLRVPVGTEIHTGDEVTIAGDVYSVVDSNFELTWPEWTTARITRLQ